MGVMSTFPFQESDRPSSTQEDHVYRDTSRSSLSDGSNLCHKESNCHIYYTSNQLQEQKMPPGTQLLQRRLPLS